MRRYRLISQCIWDDEFIIRADDLTRIVWFVLLTGPQTGFLPGLMVGTATTIAEILRREEKSVERVFDGLVSLGRIELDPFYRIIRVVNAPKHNPPMNTNVIRGWWKSWNNFPNSQLKYNHLPNLRDAINPSVKSFVLEWNALFSGYGEGLFLGKEPRGRESFANDAQSPPHDLDRDGTGDRDRDNKIPKTANPVFEPSLVLSRDGSGDPDAGKPAQLTLGIEEREASVKRLFEHYLQGWIEHVRTGRRPILDSARSNLLRDRLRDFSEQEIALAINGLWKSRWHVDNKYTSIDTVVGDASKVEKFLARAEGTPQVRPSTRPPSMEPPPFKRDISPDWMLQGKTPPKKPLPADFDLEATRARILGKKRAPDTPLPQAEPFPAVNVAPTKEKPEA